MPTSPRPTLASALWSTGAALAIFAALLTKEAGILCVPLGGLAFALARCRQADGPVWRCLVPDRRALAFGAELVLVVAAYATLRLTSGVGDPLGAGRFARGFTDYLYNAQFMTQISIGALDGTRDGPLVPWRLVGIATVVLFVLALKGARPGGAVGFALAWLILSVGLNAVTAAPWLAFIPSIGVALLVGASWTKPNRDVLKLAATVAFIALDLVLSAAWSQRWGQASTIARQTVDALVIGQADGLVLNVPFDYVDVPVFPNGLEDAVFLADGRTVHPVLYYAGSTPTLRATVRARRRAWRPARQSDRRPRSLRRLPAASRGAGPALCAGHGRIGWRPGDRRRLWNTSLGLDREWPHSVRADGSVGSSRSASVLQNRRPCSMASSSDGAVA